MTTLAVWECVVGARACDHAGTHGDHSPSLFLHSQCCCHGPLSDANRAAFSEGFDRLQWVPTARLVPHVSVTPDG